MEFMPSPPWGRGWLATGVLISRGESGEGVYPSLYYAALSNKRYYLWLSEGRGFSPAAHGRRVEWAFRP